MHDVRRFSRYGYGKRLFSVFPFIVTRNHFFGKRNLARRFVTISYGCKLIFKVEFPADPRRRKLVNLRDFGNALQNRNRIRIFRAVVNNFNGPFSCGGSVADNLHIGAVESNRRGDRAVVADHGNTAAG